MNIIPRMDGSVTIEYEARRYPRLFVPFDNDAMCRMPTDEVITWLHGHEGCIWKVSNYSFMCISFRKPDIAALFRLTFA